MQYILIKHFLDPRLRAASDGKLRDIKDWFEKRLDEAYMAAEQREKERSSKSVASIQQAVHVVKKKVTVLLPPPHNVCKFLLLQLHHIFFFITDIVYLL